MSQPSFSCLIVDDSKIVRKVTRKILEAFHIAIEEAEHGLEALEMCKQRRFRLIMLDWHMPHMNGLEFLKQFRGLPGNENTLVIFCTTETDINRIAEAMAAGANEYVMKPYDEGIIKGKLVQLGLL